MKKVYTSLRGVETTTRPMGDLSEAEREQVLRDYMTLGSKPTCEKWNIATHTIHHLVWHYKDLVQRIEDEQFRKAGL